MVSAVVVYDIGLLANITLMGKYQENNIKVKSKKTNKIHLELVLKYAMTFHTIAQLWNTNTPAFVSRDGDLTET